VYELGHATPDQVHAKVARTAAGVNITTVYRTLELLEELGLVTHAHLGHGAPTYHAVTGEEHVHLVCRSCEHVDEAPPDTVAGLIRDVAALSSKLHKPLSARLFLVPGKKAGEVVHFADTRLTQCTVMRVD
jgi:Fe2+ or Zn2+ uptake regulation protein